MDAESTRARLAAHTSGEALRELGVEIDQTRTAGALYGLDPAGVEADIRASLRRALTGRATPAEALQRLRARWVE